MFIVDEWVRAKKTLADGQVIEGVEYPIGRTLVLEKYEMIQLRIEDNEGHETLTGYCEAKDFTPVRPAAVWAALKCWDKFFA